MSQNYKITPEGTRDLIFEECTVRREVERKVSNIFKQRGFSEVITPEIEFLDVFTLKEHDISTQSMYKLSDRKGRLIALRPDSTMPIARIVATRLKNYLLPIRLCYCQKVYRANPSLRGRSDEILQSGIEVIGASNRRSDLEVITTAVEVLNQLGTDDFRFELGHIAIFDRFMESLAIEEEIKEQIRWCIERKNYPALNDLLEEHLNSENVSILKRLPQLFGGEEVFDEAIALFHNPDITETIEYLRSVYNNLAVLGLGNKITVDLGLVNRADYYSGIIFHGYISGFGESVLSGGRYDHLISDFGVDLPAIGFAVNLNAVVSAVLEKGDTPKQQLPDILLFSEPGYEMDGLLKANELIAEGKRVEHSVFESKEESREYAKKKGIRKLMVVSSETMTIELA